jgi:hypothetical protein
MLVMGDNRREIELDNSQNYTIQLFTSKMTATTRNPHGIRSRVNKKATTTAADALMQQVAQEQRIRKEQKKKKKAKEEKKAKKE